MGEQCRWADLRRWAGLLSATALLSLAAVGEAVHVGIERGAKLPSGGYEVDHGTPILGVTPDGAVPILWTEGTSAQKLAEDIQVILSEGIPPTEKGS